MELVGHANSDHIAPTRAVLKKATVPFPSQPGLTLESFQGVRWCLEVGMRLILALGITAGLTSASGSMVRAQDHQDAPTAARGAMVMGFDQVRTAHHFLLYPDGGAIEISVKDPADTANRDAIRSHLPHIAMMFSDGNFSAPMLVHDSTNVTGDDVLIERKEAIHYRYAEKHPTAAGWTSSPAIQRRWRRCISS